MDTYVTFELAYRVTKLIDLNTPHQEIAAKTGLDEDHVRQVEEWAKRVPDIPSSEDPDTFTATQILVLQYLGRTRLSRNEKAKIRRSGYQGITADRAREVVDNFNEAELFELEDQLGAEDFHEIEEILDSFNDKRILEVLIRATLMDMLPDDDEEEDDEEEEEDDDDEEEDYFEVEDDDEDEDDLMDPEAWVGPRSRLVTELVRRGPPHGLKWYGDQILYRVYRKDTLRILMDMSDFWAILSRTMAEGSTGTSPDILWPHLGPIYIELAEALPEGPEEYERVIHGFIIFEDSGSRNRGLVIPTSERGGTGMAGVRLNIRTESMTRSDGGEIPGDLTRELIRGLAAFLTDENNEIVEMPLSRSARRRLQRSGAPNPWHVVRRRIGSR